MAETRGSAWAPTMTRNQWKSTVKLLAPPESLDRGGAQRWRQRHPLLETSDELETKAPMLLAHFSVFARPLRL